MGNCQSDGAAPKKFQDVYKIGKTLGAGAFAEVKQGIKKGTDDSYAVKIVTKAKLGKEDEDALKEEIRILSSLKHPGIIRLYETFEDDKFYYLVTEEMYGGELFDRVVQKSFYNEKEARDACQSIVKAIQYCHKHHIAHRDLKPENLLLLTPGDDSQIKIADFGFAKECPDGKDCLKTQCGTPGYVAPELLKGNPYGVKADMWSMGVIAYILLGGYPPFIEEEQKKLFKKITKGDYTFHEEYWGNVSKDAKNLISSMLTVDPQKRSSADQALNHKWMTKSDDTLAQKDLGKNLKEFQKFNAKRKFKAAVKGIIAANMMQAFTRENLKETNTERQLTEEDVEDLKETFQMFDADGGGTIDNGELKSVLRKLNIDLSDTELKEIITSVDQNSDGEIDFDEFLQMMKRVPDYKTELATAFKYFDADRDGTTSKEELKRVMKQFGQKLTKAELNAVVAEVDTDGDGEISFEEFKAIMTKA